MAKPKPPHYFKPHYYNRTYYVCCLVHSYNCFTCWSNVSEETEYWAICKPVSDEEVKMCIDLRIFCTATSWTALVVIYTIIWSPSRKPMCAMASTYSYWFFQSFAWSHFWNGIVLSSYTTIMVVYFQCTHIDNLTVIATELKNIWNEVE